MERGSNRGHGEVRPSATFVKTGMENFKEIVQLLTGLPNQTKTGPHEVGLATTGPSTKRPTSNKNRPKLHIIKPTPYSRPAGSSSDRLVSPSKSRDSGSTIPNPGTTPSPNREPAGRVTPDQKNSRSRPNLQIVPPVPYFGPRTGSFTDLSLSRSSNLVAITSPGLSPTSKFSQLSLLMESNGEPPEIVMVNKEEEEKAVNEGRIYIHTSPRAGPRPAQPELLNLFPLTSPRAVQNDHDAAITRARKSLSL